ncbi:MAG: HDIG domain-containing protein [Proteobacteria bacterium]|nr:HDIG domain-containing protein [Pseudomonadota bacterium]MBU1060791.1 HDIG domain-containing protein [Pseudomonadota bacterium]
MLANIRAHSLMVTRVADLLLQELAHSQQMEPLLPDTDLVLAGALLHDIAKTPCLDNRCNHALQGRDICLELGFPEVAEIVLEHVILSDFCPRRYESGRFLAKELVYYADKRVRHEEIVSLEERLDYILERYGNNDAGRHSLIRKNFSQCQQLEGFLFSSLTIQPEDLKSVLVHYQPPALRT